MPCISRTRRTAAFLIRIFTSCVPFAPLSRAANGATNSSGNICWTSMGIASGTKQETMCSTLCRPPTGAVPKPWSIGGKHGLICAIRSLRRKVWIAGSTTAAMPVKALNRFLPSTRDRLSARWKRRASAPIRATSTAGFAKPTLCCGKQRIKSLLCWNG